MQSVLEIFVVPSTAFQPCCTKTTLPFKRLKGSSYSEKKNLHSYEGTTPSSTIGGWLVDL